MKYLLDTNVFREVGKTDPHKSVSAWLARVDDSEIAISALTIREVTKGIVRLKATKPSVAAMIEARVDGVHEALGERILPVSADIAKLWGAMLAESEKHIDDTGLAATARIHGLVLVTRNLAHVAGRGAATLDPFAAKPKINRP